MCFCVFACAFATGVARGDGTVLEDGNWLVAGPVVLPETDNYTRKYFQSVFNALPKQWSHDTAAGTAIPTKWGSMQWQSVKPDGEKPDMARLSVIDHALYFASRCWVSPKAQEAELRLGSDDAVCVWLNGERVYTYPYKRGYVPEGVVVPVKLRSGTNTAVLALINADETRSVGARMYPCSAPLDNEVFIRADNALQTGEYARIGAYWLPAAGPTNRPSLVPCTNALAVERCTVTGPSGGIVTNVLIETGTPFPQGVKISLTGLPEGVYRVAAVSGGRERASWFVRQRVSDPTREFWFRFAEYHHVHAPAEIETMFRQFPDDTAFTNAFSGSCVRAYRSKFTSGLQPYLLSVPHQLSGKTNCPLMIHLKYSAPGVTRETWSLGAFRPASTYDDVIVVTPYNYGDAGYVGLGERDLFEVVDDVAKLYGIDKDRIYAEGYSMGAGGTWRVAQRHPDFFAAVGAQGGYDCRFPMNLRNLPIWQREGEKSHPEWIAQVMAYLKGLGNDARITIERGREKATIDPIVSLQVKNWMMTKRRVSEPRHVTYTTYGDVDGAYWVRRILPMRFGYPASVSAQVMTNGEIEVVTANATRFALDLTRTIFTNCPRWKVTVDGALTTNAPSGQMFVCRLDTADAVSTGVVKDNGFCGGFADALNGSFVIAYATGGTGGVSRTRAERFRSTITGTERFQYDMDIPMISESGLTSEVCSSNHVIFFASPGQVGGFLPALSNDMPVRLVEGGAEIGGRKGTDMICTFPNPVATNRYIVCVMSTNLTARMMMTARFDVLLDGESGSFDANWDKIVWDEHDACGDGCTLGHAHDHAHEDSDGHSDENRPGQAAKPPWMRRAAGWVVAIAWCGLIAGFGIERICRKIRC